MPARVAQYVSAPPAKRARTTGTVVKAPAKPRVSHFLGYAQGATKEHKYNDVAVATYAADTTGSVTLLNGIAQGDDNNNREGRQVTMTSISIKGMLTPVDLNSNASYCRLIVVWDSANNGGAAPAITDLLTASTSVCHNNLNNRMRFKVLMDEQYVIGGISDATTQSFAGSPTVVTINRYLKLPPGCVTTFSGTGATSASIQSGAIWMFTIGNNVANAGGAYQVATRVRFVDP